MKQYWTFRQSELHFLDQIVDTYFTLIEPNNVKEYKDWLYHYLTQNVKNENVRVLLTYNDEKVNSNINSLFLEDWTILIVNKNNKDELLGKCMGTVSGLIRLNKLKNILKVCE